MRAHVAALWWEVAQNIGITYVIGITYCPLRSGRGMKRMGHDAEWQELDLLCRLFGVPRCQSKVLFTLLYRLPMVIKTHVILIT